MKDNLVEFRKIIERQAQEISNLKFQLQQKTHTYHSIHMDSLETNVEIPLLHAEDDHTDNKQEITQ